VLFHEWTQPGGVALTFTRLCGPIVIQRTSSRRITMVLDLKAAYQRLRRRKYWVYRYLTETWDSALHGYMAA
jgi:hypothetical protein